MTRNFPNQPAEDLKIGLGETMGSSTGEAERAVQAGGWAGTDDATSTAPSDQLGNPPLPEEEKSFQAIERDFDESVQKDGEQQERSAREADEVEEILASSETEEAKERLTPN